MYNKDKIFKMTGLSESEFYKKYPTKAHFEKEHGADIFAKGGFIQDDATKSNQKAFNKSEQMYNDSLALFNSANLDSQWMAKVDKNKVSRKDFNAQMQTQDRDALQDAYDRLLRTNNQVPEISSDTLNVLRSNSPKATKELILMNKYKKPTNPPLNPNKFPTKKERDAMDLRQMKLNQQFVDGGLISTIDPAILSNLSTPIKTFTPGVNAPAPTSGSGFKLPNISGFGSRGQSQQPEQQDSQQSGSGLVEGAKSLSKFAAPVGGLLGGLAGAGIGVGAAAAAAIPTGGLSLAAALPAAGAGFGLGAGLGTAAGKIGGLGLSEGAKGIQKMSNSFKNMQENQLAAYGGPLTPGISGGLGIPFMKLFADGGQLTEINAGGTHEANSNGGVPVMEGKLAEEGETIFDSDKGKYVFSDRITKGKKSFADLSKEIEKKYSKRTSDKLANESRKRELSALMLQQEAEKALASNNSQNEEMFATGGSINKTDFLSSFLTSPTGLGTLKTPGSLNPNGKYDTPKKVAGAFDIKAPNYDTEAGKSIAKIKSKYGYNSNKSNFNLKDIDLSMLEYLPQTAGSLFNIAKGIGSNKQINYKSITPKLNTSNYNLTSSLTNLNSDSAGVNADIRNNSNLSLAQKISALSSVSANTQKARASMINEGNYNNMLSNNDLINTAKQYNAGVFDRNIDANEMYQDKRAEAIKSGLDNLGTGSSTYIKDKKASKYENINNKMLANLLKELYPEAAKNGKFNLKSYGEKED